MEQTVLPVLKETYPDATEQEINVVMTDAMDAFEHLRQVTVAERLRLMENIAHLLKENRDHLTELAAAETNLDPARLRSELTRTIFQLTSYAAAARRGDVLDIRIDTGDANRNPPRPDIRKMMVPLGPVVVFGASNFPFAYSTAGGDTASALAAGCSVVVKAHPAHVETSRAVAAIISQAVRISGLPDAVFQHVHGESFDVGRWLVQHPYTKAVGFTGSLTGGKQLHDWAAQRKNPIPVFAEMGSVNPVFVLPNKLKESPVAIADMISKSVLQSVGQFCTNPGLIILLEGEGYDEFVARLVSVFHSSEPGTMLHAGVFKLYVENRANAIAQEGVELLATAEKEPSLNQGSPTIATVSGEQFIANPVLQQEVFGPWTLLVRCSDPVQLLQVVRTLDGQLTTSFMATEQDLREQHALVQAATDSCGRVIFNGVPTGVEVSAAMHHGGPYPATTDARFTSVGADAIRRFMRPVAFQNCPQEFLPEALRDDNPLGYWRLVNEGWKR